MFEGAESSGAPTLHTPVRAVEDAVTSLIAAWSRALPPFGVTVGDGDPSVLVDQFSDAGLLAVVSALGALTRRADALWAVVAAEVSRRSPSGPENLARKAGHASPGRLVAASRGGQMGRAVELVKVGQGTAARRTLAGEALPARYPHVAEGLHAGAVSVEVAHLIIAMLDRVAPRANLEELQSNEATLADQATRFTYHEMIRLVGHAERRLDPGGAAPREEAQRRARSVTMSQDATGVFHLRGTLDPVTGAPIKTALDAYVTTRLREMRGNNHPEAALTSGNAGDAGVGVGDPANEPVESDVFEIRSIQQLRADALADFARHILSCDTTTPLVPAITLVVRIDLDDLSGEGCHGYATIDGVDQPISASAARRMACDAGLIPAVFDGAPLPLDLGRRSRTFTRAQVLALWERDAGCAFCGQTTFVEAHHVRWWHRDKGTTDLSNAVLLCSRCHHLVHRDGWAITVDDAGEVTFTPPREVDPGRVPRPAAPNPRRLSTRPHASAARPPDRDDTRTRPPAGPGRAAPSTGRAERTTNPAFEERRRT